MPQAVLVAGIGAAAGLGGAALQVRGSNKAIDAQERARQEALAYERQKLAEDKARRERHAAAYRQAWLAWYARAGDEGVKRYGVPVGITLPGAQTQKPTAVGGAVRMPTPEPAPSLGNVAALSAPSQPAANPTASPSTLGGMMGLPAAQAQPAPQPQSASGWEDWSRYGVGA